MDPEELARLEAEKAAADAAAAAKAAADKAEAEKSKDKQISDTEARLLKDLMKHKAEAKTAKEAADAAAAKLKEFEGLDPAQLRALVAEKADADRQAAEKRGEYDRIIAQVRQDSDTRVAAVAAEKEEFAKRLKDAQRQIDDLTVGSSFRGSKFISDETVLTGEKARKLYGDHFEIENGEVVAYDKPRGASDRTPLVDTRTGLKLGFEDALEKIVKTDSDFERIAKSKLRTGSNSAPGNLDKKTDSKAPVLSGRALIAASLNRKK